MVVRIEWIAALHLSSSFELAVLSEYEDFISRACGVLFNVTRHVFHRLNMILQLSYLFLEVCFHFSYFLLQLCDLPVSLCGVLLQLSAQAEVEHSHGSQVLELTLSHVCG